MADCRRLSHSEETEPNERPKNVPEFSWAKARSVLLENRIVFVSFWESWIDVNIWEKSLTNMLRDLKYQFFFAPQSIRFQVSANDTAIFKAGYICADH